MPSRRTVNQPPRWSKRLPGCSVAECARIEESREAARCAARREPVDNAYPSGHMIAAVALRLVQVNVKARDDSALGRFWAEALGWSVSSEGPGVTNVQPVGFVWPAPAAVCVDVVTVPDPETVK